MMRLIEKNAEETAKQKQMAKDVHITTIKNNVLHMQCKNNPVYTVKYDFSKIIGIGLQ